MQWNPSFCNMFKLSLNSDENILSSIFSVSSWTFPFLLGFYFILLEENCSETMSLAEWGVPLPSPAWSAKKTTYMGQKTSTWFPIHAFTQELGPSSWTRRVTENRPHVIRGHPRPGTAILCTRGSSSMRVLLIQAKGSRSWRGMGPTCSNPLTLFKQEVEEPA